MPSYDKKPRSCLSCGTKIEKPRIYQKYCSRKCAPTPATPTGEKCPSYKHGGKGTIFYKRFLMMRERCVSSKHKSYKDYGGRGILCLWENYEEFKKDMYSSYVEHCTVWESQDTTLERIDVNGNYCKDNCRWATRKEQSRNKRDNKLLTFMEKTQCISAWGEELNLCRKVIEYRIRNNWPTELALTIKVDHRNKINGITTKATSTKNN